jgi:hypothetical protein
LPTAAAIGCHTNSLILGCDCMQSVKPARSDATR